MKYSLGNTAMPTDQAGFVAVEALRKPYVERFMLVDGRTIPVVARSLSLADRWGGIKARWGSFRMHYRVLPGLYAVGSPDKESVVFVTSNYKMSFDALRSSLPGIDAWLLILDTKGVNVWCAAGEGTFGTAELVSRISRSKLSSIVSHRNLVLPQLGATGVSAAETARLSGFRVHWGPVRAADIEAWLAADRKKDDAMREVRFGLRDRMAVAPIEIAHSWPLIPAALLLGALFGLPFGPGWLGRSLPVIVLLLGTIPVGTILFPAILPWIPSRFFVVKGAILGALWTIAWAFLFRVSPMTGLSGLLIATPMTAFFAMNFTGASTYTCQPGALKEVVGAFWPMAISLVASLAAGSVTRIFGF
jgi:hypothetical protein